MFKQVGEKQALLREELNHPRYHWPKTLLRLPWAGQAGFRSAADQYGRRYPVQRDRQGRLCLAADLAAGAEKRFTFSPETVKSGLTLLRQGDSWQMENENLRLTIYFTGPVLFTLCREDVRLTGRVAGEQERAVMVLEQGGVFAEIQVCLVLEGSVNCRYIFRMHENSQFVDFYEEYEKNSAAALQMAIEIPGQDIRFTPDRGREKIDRYLQAGGEIPFMILPYEAPVGWYQTKCAAFGRTEGGLSAGIFIRDGRLWQDYQYALWSSDDAYAIRFWHRPQEIEAVFPAVRSTRYSALAIFASPVEYIEDLYTWYCFYDLDKVKDWVLDWTADQGRFPVHFTKADFQGNIVEKEFAAEDAFFQLLENFRNLREPAYFDPVCNREMFTILPAFDALAAEMEPAEFGQCRRYLAFLAYSAKDENFMPIENMLAGHPNFLMDAKIPVGMFGAYFPEHPMAGEFIEHTRRAVALNFKYHTRPDVPAWDAQGGRWTENLGCYTFAMLSPLIKGAAIIGDDLVLTPDTVRYAKWLLGALSAPVNGRRSYPPQGAHAGGHLKNPFYPIYHIRMLAYILEDYAPTVAQQLFAVCPADAPEWHHPDGVYEVWHKMLSWREQGNKQGVPPTLASKKYTGYGCILRAAVNMPGEMSVHIGQIDDGPNYRMGLAGDGGCGVVYYYAAGRQYSYNRPEDAGDYMLGDVDNCTNFGVMKDKEFHSIGRGDLTNPLVDLGTVQWTKFTASPKIQPDYRSKGVLMVDNDYIVLYEEVGGMRTKGRLAWFTNINGQFPNIYQLKPGAAPQEKALLPAKNTDIETCGKLASPDLDSKGIYYDGFGDFLTVVSHKTLSAEKTDYGARVQSEKGTDYIFYDSSHIRHTEGIMFSGYIGFVRQGVQEAVLALICGEVLCYGGIEIRTEPGISVALTGADGQAQGMVYVDKPGGLAVSAEAGNVYVDGEIYTGQPLEKGYHPLQISAGGPKPGDCKHIQICESASEIAVSWTPAANAEYYEIMAGPAVGTWEKLVVNTSQHLLRPAEDTVYFKIRGVNGDFPGNWSPVQIACRRERPGTPKGLAVCRQDGKDAVSWGSVQGAAGYVLYQNGEAIYRGVETMVTVTGGGKDVYQVAAFNGAREGERSQPRRPREHWDPMPGEAFRRDTRSHEHGYDGFDFINNLKAGVLTYPQDQ